jgi:hypothetical protein
VEEHGIYDARDELLSGRGGDMKLIKASSSRMAIELSLEIHHK